MSVNSVGSFLYSATVKAKDAAWTALSSVLGLFDLWLHYAWTGKNVHNSNVVVVLTTSKDHNGAFSFPHMYTTYQLHSHKEFQIIYKKVSSIEEIEAALTEIKQQNNRIKGLWIRAHGQSSGFTLGEKNDANTHRVSNCFIEMNDIRLGSGSANKLKKSLDMIDDDASIILHSCLTGRIPSSGDASIAQTIAQLAPHRRIFAPVQVVNGVGLHFAWDKDAIAASFTAPKKSSYTGTLKKITDFFYTALHICSLGYYGDEITAHIKGYSKKECEGMSHKNVSVRGQT